jgi:hypothetical protein
MQLMLLHTLLAAPLARCALNCPCHRICLKFFPCVKQLQRKAGGKGRVNCTLDMHCYQQENTTASANIPLGIKNITSTQHDNLGIHFILCAQPQLPL